MVELDIAVACMAMSVAPVFVNNLKQATSKMVPITSIDAVLL
jgi:hypothetical protein